MAFPTLLTRVRQRPGQQVWQFRRTNPAGLKVAQTCTIVGAADMLAGRQLRSEECGKSGRVSKRCRGLLACQCKANSTILANNASKASNMPAMIDMRYRLCDREE